MALRVVVDNLLDNAFKYGGDGATVTLRVRSDAGRALVSVEDHGIGFAPSQAEGLFKHRNPIP